MTALTPARDFYRSLHVNKPKLLDQTTIGTILAYDRSDRLELAAALNMPGIDLDYSILENITVEALAVAREIVVEARRNVSHSDEQIMWDIGRLVRDKATRPSHKTLDELVKLARVH